MGKKSKNVQKGKGEKKEQKDKSEEDGSKADCNNCCLVY